MKNLPYFYGSHDKFEELAGPMLEIPKINLGVTMRLIIQDRNNVIFNGINISDEVKSQVTGINFITKNMKLTRNATYFERLKAKLFGNYSTSTEIFKTIVLGGWKKYSIYIEGVKTTVPFHRQLLDNPGFLAGNYTTKFMETFVMDRNYENLI